MKKRKKWMALALAGFLLLPGCSGPAPELPETAAPVSSAAPLPPEKGEGGKGFALPCYSGAGFHPLTGSNRLNLTLSPLLYRGLFSVDNRFQAEKDLCESYTVSEDGLTWTFRLTEASFSDGSPLTAREAADSLNAARRSDRYQGRLENVKRVAAEGETVVVTLGETNGSLPLLLDIPIIKEGEDPQRPLGTGPYALREEEDLAMVARTGAQVPLETIPLREVEAGDDLVYAFDAREISLVDTDLTGIHALGYSGRLETTDYPTTTLLYIGCNLTSGSCREEKVRQAVAFAVDREKMVERILLGHGRATSLPLHPDAPGYDATLARQWEMDRERAGALLEEGGWSPGEDGGLVKGRESLELRLVVNQDNTFKTAIAQEIARELEELGCRVTLDKLSWEEYTEALQKREFDLYLGETALTSDFDLGALLGPNGALNYSGFSDGESWTLMAQCRASQGEEREATLVNCCGRIAEQAPIIPLCFKNGSLLTQWGQVAGASPTQRDVFAGLENWRIRDS